jgi:hypothetical protein
MKTQMRRSGRTLRDLALLVTCGLMLAGCVPSLHPLYTERDVVYDEALLGVWSQSLEHHERWRFEPLEGKAYRVTYEEGDERGVFTGRLLQLDGQRYLDFDPVRDDLEELGRTGFFRIHWVAAHSFARVELEAGVLRLAPTDAEWVSKHLEEHPGSLAHVRRVGEDDELVLTASTEALQAFVKEHKDEMFIKPMELRRIDRRTDDGVGRDGVTGGF